MLYALLGSNAIMILSFILRYKTFPPQIPLFYTHSIGEEQLGEWWMIFLLPLLLNVFALMNRFIYKKFFPSNTFIAKTIYYLNLFLMISITLIFIKIVLLVS